MGTQALAAASAVLPIHSLFVGVLTGFSLGASLLLAQACGAGDTQKMQACAENMTIVLAAVGFGCTALALGFGPALLSLTRTPAELLPDAVCYLRILAVGYFAQALYQFLADALRALGDSRTPLWFLVFAALLNIVLDAWFLAGLGLGVAGVGWATLIAEAVAAAGCLVYTAVRCPLLRVDLRRLHPDGHILRALLHYGSATALQQTIGSVGGMLQQTVVNGFGSAAIAAYNTAYKVDNLLLLPCIGLGSALSLYTAQNLGAGQRARMQQGLRACVLVTAAFSAAASVGIFAGAKGLTLVFLRAADTAAVAESMRGLRLLAPLYLLCNEISLMTNFCKGAGRVSVAANVSIAQIVLRVAFAFGLAGTLGMDAVWLCMPVTWVVCSVFYGWYYWSGRWDSLASAGERKLEE